MGAVIGAIRTTSSNLAEAARTRVRVPNETGAAGQFGSEGGKWLIAMFSTNTFTDIS
jgi:hypothetical protein